MWRASSGTRSSATRERNHELPSPPPLDRIRRRHPPILPPPARAQTVRGKVVEDSVLLPVPGAFVTLRGTAGLVVAGSLTGSSGTFQLTGKAGKYTLHVERLGYRSFSTAVFRLDTTQVRELRVSSAPVALPSLSIEARRKCKPANALGPEEILIWEELRKSLAVADWTATESGISMMISGNMTCGAASTTSMSSNA